MKKLLLFFILTVPVIAQNHIGASFGTSRYIGVPKPNLGINIGRDSKSYAADFDIYTLCKVDGGCGYQLDMRGTIVRHSVQAGIAVSHYSVEKYSKSSVQLLVGFKRRIENIIIEANYRKDLTSINHVNFIESRVSMYGSHHLFARLSSSLNIFNGNRKGVTAGVVTGLYW